MKHVVSFKKKLYELDITHVDYYHPFRDYFIAAKLSAYLHEAVDRSEIKNISPFVPKQKAEGRDVRITTRRTFSKWFWGNTSFTTLLFGHIIRIENGKYVDYYGRYTSGVIWPSAITHFVDHVFMQIPFIKKCVSHAECSSLLKNCQKKR